MPKVSNTKPIRIALSVWLILAIGYVSLIPVSNNFVLYPLLGSLGILAGIAVWRDRVVVDRALLVPAALWLLYVAFGILVAVVRDAESWPRTLVFLLFWPVLFFVVVAGSKRFIVKIVFYTGAAITILIAMIFLVGALAALEFAPFDSLPRWITAPIALRFVVDGGAIALSSHSLPPLLWWGAMWMASLACSRENVYLPPVWVRTLAASLALAASIVSWRRAILLVLVLSPLIALVVWLLLKVKNNSGTSRRTPTLAVAVRVATSFALAGAIAIGLQPQTPSIVTGGIQSIATIFGQADILSTDDLEGEFSISEDDDLADKIRQNELRSLTRVDSAADLFVGRGIGATTDRGEFVRDMKPWQTELQYHAMFYWTGLVGVGFIIAVAITGVRALRKAFRSHDSLRGVLFVASVGAAATLIGNATNPYIQAPGHMWPVFLPFMIASVMLGAGSDAFGATQHRNESTGQKGLGGEA